MKTLAKILALPLVRNYLIRKAQRTPYFHLDGYMQRWWLVPYAENVGDGCGPVNGFRRPIAWLLQRKGYAVRVHHILRADATRHHHDHPWDARTFVLRNWYIETRLFNRHHSALETEAVYVRMQGDTAEIKHGQYHTITDVAEGGVWTLFVTREYKGTWGFWVDGRKVPWREYAGRQ